MSVLWREKKFIYHWYLVLQEAVADTLEELWLSYNIVEKLKGITVLSKLKVYHLLNIAAMHYNSVSQDPDGMHATVIARYCYATTRS